MADRTGRVCTVRASWRAARRGCMILRHEPACAASGCRYRDTRRSYAVTPDTVLDFWFGALRDGWTAEDRSDMWFRGDAELDAQLRARFGEGLERAAQGACDDWQESATGALALILLFDQFPRNMFRGTAQAFAYDERALTVCEAGLATGQDARLPPVCRIFFYLPLQHSEDPGRQERSVELYARLRAQAGGGEAIRERSLSNRDGPAKRGIPAGRRGALGPEQLERRRVALEESYRHALAHRDLIVRFGRFPHRGAVLGRKSTVEERAYLQSSGQHFGQG